MGVPRGETGRAVPSTRPSRSDADHGRSRQGVRLAVGGVQHEAELDPGHAVADAADGASPITKWTPPCHGAPQCWSGQSWFVGQVSRSAIMSETRTNELSVPSKL